MPNLPPGLAPPPALRWPWCSARVARAVGRRSAAAWAAAGSRFAARAARSADLGTGAAGPGKKAIDARQ